MRKIVILCCIAVLLLSLCPVAHSALAKREAGGVPAFFIGCCWGIRVGTEWNEGADLHWREWGRIIPVVGFVCAIWDGVDCANGMTAHQWAEKNGANWF